jgi:hypothetical protein
MGTSLQSKDFMTDEEILQHQNKSQKAQILQPQEKIVPTLSDINIPDMENIEGIPAANKRLDIKKEIDSVFNGKVKTIEDQIQRDVQEAQNKKFNSMPNTPKDVLKKLIAHGEYMEDFQVFGVTWTLRAMDQGDTLLMMEEVKDTMISQTGRIIAIMFGTVIYSVQAINGTSIYEWFDEIKPVKYSDRMEYHTAVRYAFRKYLEAMPPAIIDELYSKYLEVDAKRILALEELKNS